MFVSWPYLPGRSFLPYLLSKLILQANSVQFSSTLSKSLLCIRGQIRRWEQKLSQKP